MKKRKEKKKTIIIFNDVDVICKTPNLVMHGNQVVPVQTLELDEVGL